MRNNCFFVNVLLALITGLCSLVALLVQTFVPAAVLPPLCIPLLAALSLSALVLEGYLAPQVQRTAASHLLAALLAALTFSLLPRAAGLLGGDILWKLALVGGLTFLAADALYCSMRRRLAFVPAPQIAPALAAALLLLALQSFTGIFL